MSELTGAPVGVELLDDRGADPVAVRLSLRNIARANRYFGGWSIVRTGLRRLLRHPHPGAVTMLDVGTGAGDLSQQARRWAARRGLEIRPIGLDQHGAAARLAREAGVAALVGSGSALPLGDRSVDIVLLSQVAHHLAPPAFHLMVRELTRVSRLGVVLADLRPSTLAGAAYRLTGPLLGFDHHTVTDGITSLRRGFTTARLEAELAGAGIAAWIRPRLGVRIVAVWRSDGAPA